MAGDLHMSPLLLMKRRSWYVHAPVVLSLPTPIALPPMPPTPGPDFSRKMLKRGRLRRSIAATCLD
jgi:hypothetical protein